MEHFVERDYTRCSTSRPRWCKLCKHGRNKPINRLNPNENGRHFAECIHISKGSLVWFCFFYINWCVKVTEDDIALKLAILKKSLHLNDNTCFCSIIQSSKLFWGSLLAKNNFFVRFWTKNVASSRMANCGSGLPAEWPFRSQNAIEASDSPLPCGLPVKRLITHAYAL